MDRIEIQPNGHEPRQCRLWLSRVGWTVGTAFVFVAATTAVQFGWPVYRQTTTIKWIRQVGGYVDTVPGTPAWLQSRLSNKWRRLFDQADYVSFDDIPATDDWLAFFPRLPRVRTLTLRNTRVTDEGLAPLSELRDLQFIALDGAPVTDAALAHLRELPSLQAISIENTPVTDAGLAQLGGMPNLDLLSLGGTHITDAGLSHLKALPRLEELGLFNTPITDTGMECLKDLPRLRILWLGKTQITDAGLIHLETLTNLDEIYLDGTQVSDKGIARLKQALPNLTVFR